jgi:chemotaxis protein methyltransferase CheR
VKGARSGPPVPLSDEAYHLLNELLEERFGLHFPERRRQVLESRLQPRIKALHLTNAMDYLVLLQADRNGEMKECADLTTNNETYFFREAHQFDALMTEGVGLVKPQLARPGTLSILCAGSSSGEEPYTLNFFVKGRPPVLGDLNVEIHAFDLDHRRVEIAKGARCRERSLREMTPEQVQRYLTRPSADEYEVRPAYRAGVRFAEGNIVNLATFRPVAPYDVIFCRNVLIYFSEGALRRAIDNFAQVLRPGGLLFLGHAESIIGLSPCFETVRIGGGVAYRRTAC